MCVGDPFKNKETISSGDTLVSTFDDYVGKKKITFDDERPLISLYVWTMITWWMVYYFILYNRCILYIQKSWMVNRLNNKQNIGYPNVFLNKIVKKHTRRFYIRGQFFNIKIECLYR